MDGDAIDKRILEPTITDNPATSRVWSCPDGYALANQANTWYNGGVVLYSGQTDGPKGDIQIHGDWYNWQKPETDYHVCISKKPIPNGSSDLSAPRRGKVAD